MADFDRVWTCARLLLERAARPVVRLLEFFAGSLRRVVNVLFRQEQPITALHAIALPILVSPATPRGRGFVSCTSVAELAPAISLRGPPFL